MNSVFIRRCVAFFTAVIFAWSMAVPPAIAETINLEGGTVDVTAQDNITNWNVTGNPVWNVPEFNVAQGSTYNISGLSNGASLALLVGGGSASNIFGTMNITNLDFILQNVYGINIGSTGFVNLTNANFIASTLPLNLDSTNFLSHQYEFEGDRGFILNEGRIVGHDASLVALVANAIENKGTIEVPMGTVALAAGNLVTIGISGDGMVTIGVDEATANSLGLKDQIKNSGSITADGGKVSLTAKAIDGLFDNAINITGEPNAIGVVKSADGVIEFVSDGDILNSGKIEAERGVIKMTSEEGAITNAGTLDAAKGSIEINTEGVIENRGVLRADILREHGYTFKVSGFYAVKHAYYDNTDLAAHFDGATIEGGTHDDVNFSFSSSSTISVAAVFNASNSITLFSGANVTLGGNTTFNADSDSSGSGAFTMASDATITGGGYNVTLKASDNSTIGILSNVGTLEIARNATDADIIFSSSSTTDDLDVDVFKTTSSTATGVTFTKTVGDGLAANTAYLIYDITQLQGMANDLDAYYKLANSIDASSTSSWAFSPIGTFTGTFDGNNHVIDSLNISQGGGTSIGLFSQTSAAATVQNVGLTSVSISGMDYVGALVGRNNGTISNAYSTGTLSGNGTYGGLVGTMDAGTLSDSWSSVSVSGGNHLGGLVGGNSATILRSYATGTVNGDENPGGLVGNNYGTIQDSYATGAVTSSSSWNIRGAGGLVADNQGTILNSYATGNVSGSNNVGGLVGTRYVAGTTITDSYATGTVSGSGNLGGLLGGDGAGGTITNSYFTDAANDNGFGTLEAGGASAFNGSAHAVYAGWTFGDGGGGWNSFSGGLPHLDWEWSTTITTLLQLQNMSLNLGGAYTLANNIDAASTQFWNSGAGFDPVGDAGTNFTGSFSGQGHTISGLTIARSSEDNVGLFGFAGAASAISNVGITGSGTITGHNNVGGLVGQNAGSVTNAYAMEAVTGNIYFGGLVGINTGSVSSSYATGSVSGGSGGIGGLVGRNDTGGSIANSYATGTVSGTFNDIAGLAGENFGTITNSYATGNVSGVLDVGGLVGWQNGTITNSFATGSVTGTTNVGGLVGDNSGTVTNSYFTDSANNNGIGTLVSSASVFYAPTHAVYDIGNANQWNIFTPTWDTFTNALPHLASENYGGATANYVWSGATSTAWNTATNWSTGIAPVAASTVYIFDRPAANDPLTSGEVTLTNLTITSGALDINGNNIYITGNFSLGVDGDISGFNNINVRMYLTGTGAQSFSDGDAVARVAQLVINKASGTVTFGDAPNINNMWIDAGTLDLNGYDLVVNGDLSVTGTLNGTGSVTVSGGDVTGNGTINLTGGTFLLDGTGNFGGNTDWTFYNLTFGNGVGAATTTKTAGSTGNITVSNNFSIAANQTFNADNDTYTVGGSWSNSGTFTAGTSTVALNGANQAINGNNTFYNLSKTVAAAATLTFESGKTQTITGALTLRGAANQLLTLSPSGASAWNLDPQGTATLQYLNIQNANNVSGRYLDPQYSVVDGASSASWVTPAPVVVTPSVAGNTAVNQTLAAIDQTIASVNPAVTNIVTNPPQTNTNLPGLTGGDGGTVPIHISGGQGDTTPPPSGLTPPSINTTPPPADSTTPPTVTTKETTKETTRETTRETAKETTTPSEETAGEGTADHKTTGGGQYDLSDWKTVPFDELFKEINAADLLTNVRVMEGAVYVLDSWNDMSLLERGESKRILRKLLKKKQAKVMIREETPVKREAVPASPSKTGPAEKTAAKAVSPFDGVGVGGKKVVREDKPVLRPLPMPLPMPAGSVKERLGLTMDKSAKGVLYATLKNPGKNVFVKDRNGEWIPAADGMVLLAGDMIKTAEKDTVSVVLDGGKVGRLDIKGGSLFRIHKLEEDPVTKDRTTLIDLALGKMIVKVEGLKGQSRFEVKTPTALTGVRGTTFEVEVKEKSKI